MASQLEVPDALEQKTLLSSNTDPKGASILVGLTSQGTVTFWHITADGESRPGTLPIPNIEAIAISQNGDFVAMKSSRGIHIWAMRNAKQEVLFVPGIEAVHMEFARDGRSLYLLDDSTGLRVLSTYAD